MERIEQPSTTPTGQQSGGHVDDAAANRLGVAEPATIPVGTQRQPEQGAPSGDTTWRPTSTAATS